MSQPKSYITALSIIAITTLISIALFKGIDGVLLTSGIGLLAGIGGFWIGKRNTSKHSN